MAYFCTQNLGRHERTELNFKFETLPEHLQQQVLDYIEFLLSREAKKQQRCCMKGEVFS